MKPLALFLPVFIICVLFVFVLPHLIRFPWGRIENLPVGVTALSSELSSTTTDLESPSSTELHTGNNLATNGYTGLKDFTAMVYNGLADEVVGVYAPGLFALPVRQQPAGQPDFVDRDNNVLTEFSLPKKFGSTGLLAHNYLSGSRFFQLKPDQDVVLIYGNGRLEYYRISGSVSYQALKPNSPFSDFVDAANPNSGALTSADLFNRVYTTRHQLVFQTCIESDDEPSWGRLFILASPIQLSVPPFNTISNSN